MLSRRSCSSSGSSAAYVGGRGLEIPRVFRPAAPRTPSLRPAVGRNLESWRRFSTEARDKADQKKAESVLRMWWQRSKNCLEHFNVEDKARVLFWYSLVGFGTAT
uniref:Uncharacterized protein n=1 Tax=Arundo donax TaxID=35708 RepID=A0A0A8XUY7_ARUDO